MTKSDQSKHNICIASIKRSTMQPYDFNWTKFHEANADFQRFYPNIKFDLSDDELIICSTVIDDHNFSVFTTRQLITNENGNINSGEMEGVTDKGYGYFKGPSLFTFGYVQLKDGHDLKYFIEVGKASMVMIHGVRTLINTQQMTAEQVQNLPKVWDRKSKE